MLHVFCGPHCYLHMAKCSLTGKALQMCAHNARDILDISYIWYFDICNDSVFRLANRNDNSHFSFVCFSSTNALIFQSYLVHEYVRKEISGQTKTSGHGNTDWKRVRPYRRNKCLGKLGNRHICISDINLVDFPILKLASRSASDNSIYV